MLKIYDLPKKRQGVYLLLNKGMLEYIHVRNIS